MTEKEARAKSEDKISQIKELALKLQVKITAKQAITQGNIIESLVFYVDMEDYPIDAPEAVVPGPNKLPPTKAVHVSKMEEAVKNETTITDLPK